MTSATRIVFTPTGSETELRLLSGSEAIAPSAWPLSGHPAAALAQRLLIEESAIEVDDCLLVNDGAIARLTAGEAAQLDLPPATTLRAVIEGSGIMMAPGFQVGLRWTRPGGQNVLGVQRKGAWLEQPDGWRRLPETLFVIAEAVDRHAAAAKLGEADRLKALADLRAALPQAAIAGSAEASGLLGSVTIVEADALSLDVEGEGDAMQLVPVLHRAGAGDAPLLPEDRQKNFGIEQFRRWPGARGVYSLPGNVYVVIAPPLRAALDVVWRTIDAPPSERRSFLREPRAAIRAAIGDEADATVLDALVIETAAWSERVIGLGLWQPRVVPWVQLESNDWFGPEAGERGARGIVIDGTTIPLTQADAKTLAEAVGAAMAAGRPSVTHIGPDASIDIPANEETLGALAALTPRPKESEPASAPRQVLLIKPNEQEREIEALVQRRPMPPAALPSGLRTSLKQHQQEGLTWLQRNWASGSPGVLLADDMGLGKTLQGLAFMAWLRQGMAKKAVPHAPMLIVAPTGLLENWRAEHERHLLPPGLGTLLAAYGKGLAALRRQEGSLVTLDRTALAGADWVLTTYETLRDHDRDFGAVRFAVMLLDEAQKVKTPGIRLTDAAKAMSADFRVALTGTPVENRLSDLWCIVDGVAPGHLGDLRRFSADYEARPDVDRIKSLKATLDQPIGGRPPLLLRRLKEDRLPDLPPREDVVVKEAMSGRQLTAYLEAVKSGRDSRALGRVLEALQRLRSVSLCADSEGAASDDDLVAASARLRLALRALDSVAAKDERALVFIDDLALMARLAGLLQRRYRMRATPMTINGKVAGAARQARVDLFQNAAVGFDVMLLSPRAGGVGLTLTRANHVIHLARWWNPAVEDQCTGRVLRLGQDRPVTVHLPLAVLPNGQSSFDENLHALLQRKRALMHEALMPPDPGHDELAAFLDDSLCDSGGAA
jgi:hypothetical protein